MDQSNRQLHTIVRGSGNAILLAHGLTGSTLNWSRLSKDLIPNYQTVAFDFIGHARSHAPSTPEAYRLPTIIRDIDHLIDTGCNGSAVLCGLSMGAAAMLLYALQHPTKVQGLILTSFPPGKEVANTISAIAAPFSRAILTQGLQQAGEQFVWGEKSAFAKSDAELIKQGFSAHPHPHGLAYCMSEFLAQIPTQAELAEQIQHLNIPTLLIAGERDKPSLHYSQALATALPNHRLVVIENGGHLVNIDSHIQYNIEVKRFLDSLYQQGA